jgi:anthranilate phosphoribosyltransferase
MKHVGPTRVELGTRTIFNLLGPLSNPANVKRQMVGVFARPWVEPLAHVLAALGSERAWVVHGSDGLDEITTTGPTYVAELSGDKVRAFEVAPEDVGVKRAASAELKGGDATANAAALRNVLDGKPGPFRDIALMNAAAALVVAGKGGTLPDTMKLAVQSVDSGEAKKRLDRLVSWSASAPTSARRSRRPSARARFPRLKPMPAPRPHRAAFSPRSSASLPKATTR